MRVRQFYLGIAAILWAVSFLMLLAWQGYAASPPLYPLNPTITPHYIQIAAGESHTCGLTETGGVHCWGWGQYGPLGDGSQRNRAEPVTVIGLNEKATAITLGDNHSCALLESGKVKCWGDNRSGQLGSNGATPAQLTPIDVMGLEGGVTAVVAGGGHTCAIMQDKAVKCWGSNGFGELGGSLSFTSPIPIHVSGLDAAVTALALGTEDSCALTTNGAVRCWGQGQSTPVGIVGLESGVKAITAHFLHRCALMQNGEVKCWGWNEFGQLGDGSTTESATPVTVLTLQNAIAITAGSRHVCAITSSGGGKCWGANYMGQLGDGTLTNSPTPVTVQGLSNVSALAAGAFHTCALLNDHTVHCWGWNRYGQLGNGDMAEQPAPVDVLGLDHGVTKMAAGMGHTCAVTSLDTVQCWGAREFQSLEHQYAITRTQPVTIAGLESGVSAITVGYRHSCVIQSGGVKCWGWSHGGLGDGLTEFSVMPVEVIGLTSGVQIITAGGAATSGDHTCALLNDGTVKCWGANRFGELGDGTTTNRPTPTDVINLGTPISAIDTAGLHTCALTNQGQVTCWGANHSGELGDGTTENRITPTQVISLNQVITAITVGGNDSGNNGHSCVLTTGGVKCWGNNSQGQLGDGTRVNRAAPVNVLGLSNNVRAIAAGGFHTCALTTAGSVFCWGDNRFGQLPGNPTTESLIPIAINGLSNDVVDIVAGAIHTCALTSRGSMHCWGSDLYEQLGDGPTIVRTEPVDVRLTATSQVYLPLIIKTDR